MIQQTRFKVVLLGLTLGLIEGLIRAFKPEFPVIEVFSFQSAVIGGYMALKTASNATRIKAECGEVKANTR